MNSIFYVAAACAAALQGGIHRVELASDGSARVTAVTRVDAPNYLLFSPDRKMLYATCAHSGRQGVASFAVGPDGALTQRNFASGPGKTPCHPALSPDGKFLFTANYSSGDLSVFTVGGDGAAHFFRTVARSGNGPDKRRQKSPHPHCVMPAPDGKFLAVADLGTDEIALYPFDPGRGIDERQARGFKVSPGSGVRHLAFSPDGRLLYAATELGNTLAVFAYDRGELRKLAEIPTLPGGFRGKSYAGAVRIAPDGRFVLVTNRGDDSTAVFSTDGAGGAKLLAAVPSGGRYPRDAAWIGNGLFAAANELGNSVTFYSWNPQTGTLAPRFAPLALPRPVAILQFQ